MELFWLSFYSPTQEKFLGVACVLAETHDMALAKTHSLKINPGGEVLVSNIPLQYIVPDTYLNRLLAAEEALKLKNIVDNQFLLPKTNKIQ